LHLPAAGRSSANSTLAGFRLHEIYPENIQNRAKKSGCIFIPMGGQHILNPAMPVQKEI